MDLMLYSIPFRFESFLLKFHEVFDEWNAVQFLRIALLDYFVECTGV